MRSFQWEYIAGFVDGEGHISMSANNGFCARVMLSQVGVRGQLMLSELRQWLLAHGIKGRVSTTSEINPKWQKAYRLDIDSRESVRLLLIKVLPFLHIKKCEAQDVLRTLTLFPSMNTGIARRTIQRDCAHRAWETRRRNLVNLKETTI